MKKSYLIITLVLASSAAVMGNDTTKKTPGTLLHALKLKEEKIKSFWKKGITELALENVYMFVSALGGRYLLDKVTNTPHDFKHNIASSALFSTLLAQIIFPGFKAISQVNDHQDDGVDEYKQLSLSPKNLRTHICELSSVALCGLAAGLLSVVIPGENPSNKKVIGCIAASVAIQVFLAKTDELGLRKVLPYNAMAAVLHDFEAEQTKKKKDAEKSAMNEPTQASDRLNNN